MNNAPSGLRPVGHINGGEWNGKVSTYYVASTDINTFQRGDVVISSYGASSGVIQGRESFGVQQVTKAGTGSNPRGVVTDTQADLFNTTPYGLPATKDKNYLIYVADDPLIIFEIQCNNTTTLPASIMGKYADIVVATGTAMSGTQLDVNTISTSPSTLRILGLSRGDYSSYAKLLVCFNYHELG